MSLFSPADRDLLLDLLALPTAGPLEGGPGAPAPQLWQAQRRYAAAAAEFGCAVVHHAAPPPECLERDDVPLPVREAAAADAEFLTRQPSMVLALGPADAPRERTVMFNVHLDTVAGLEDVAFDGERFHGRGAIDAKGPAVALLAGLRHAVREQPESLRDTRVLVQAVSGEEGGALGTYGTRPLVEAGHHGRLNVFCEPTGGRALLRCTAAMTARLSVHGSDAIDDRPGAGHNATVLLGHLAQHLAAALDPALDPADGQVCVAGLHTGTLHNRVYGSGQLLLNLSYGSAAAGRRLEGLLRDAVAEGLRSFTAAFRHSRRFARTAADAADIVRLEWLKRGLPALGGDQSRPGPLLGPLLARAGVPLWPAAEPGFTCDAIWMSGVPGAECVVLGPGRLDTNRAHAPGEFADLAELDAFAATIPRLLTAFHATPDRRPPERPRNDPPPAARPPAAAPRPALPPAAAQPLPGPPPARVPAEPDRHTRERPPAGSLPLPVPPPLPPDPCPARPTAAPPPPPDVPASHPGSCPPSSSAPAHAVPDRHAPPPHAVPDLRPPERPRAAASPTDRSASPLPAVPAAPALPACPCVSSPSRGTRSSS